jgi:hypothetical protein
MMGEAENMCPICLETPPRIPCFMVPCGHTFCLKCCELLFQDKHEPISCPLCRQTLDGFTEKKHEPRILIDGRVIAALSRCKIVPEVEYFNSDYLDGLHLSNPNEGELFDQHYWPQLP